MTSSQSWWEFFQGTYKDSQKKKKKKEKGRKEQVLKEIPLREKRLSPCYDILFQPFDYLQLPLCESKIIMGIWWGLINFMEVPSCVHLYSVVVNLFLAHGSEVSGCFGVGENGPVLNHGRSCVSTGLVRRMMHI